MKFWCLVPLIVAIPFSGASGTEIIVPANADVGNFFGQLPADITSIVFTASATYHSEGDILLPDVQLLVIDGRGSKLTLGAASNGFTRRITNQTEVAKKLTCRYVIRDFSAIEGGRKGIDLQATLGSLVINCRMHDQTETAIDLRFCLMTRIENVLVTNPVKDGIVIRTGDWPGASATNSQSNSAVLEQCRVFCSNTTINAYSVLNSGGVRMSDCISEGGASDRDILLSAEMHNDHDRQGTNPTMKSFTLENFHVEHRVRKESIFVNMTPQAAVNLDNVYWNGWQSAPAIRYVRGQLNLSNFGWWTDDLRIATRISAPRINVSRCHSKLRLSENTTDPDRSGSFVLEDPLPEQTKLDVRYIRITEPSH